MVWFGSFLKVQTDGEWPSGRSIVTWEYSCGDVKRHINTVFFNTGVKITCACTMNPLPSEGSTELTQKKAMLQLK